MFSTRQAELFAVAAAVSGKDYWCLLSSGTSASSDGGRADVNVTNATRQRQRGEGDGDVKYQWEGQDAPDAVRVPPSLRAVVIAVLFANRLTASAREASAACATFAVDVDVDGGGGRGAGAEARLERRHRQRQRVGGGGPLDSRYMVSDE